MKEVLTLEFGGQSEQMDHIRVEKFFCLWVHMHGKETIKLLVHCVGLHIFPVQCRKDDILCILNDLNMGEHLTHNWPVLRISMIRLATLSLLW